MAVGCEGRLGVRGLNEGSLTRLRCVRVDDLSSGVAEERLPTRSSEALCIQLERYPAPGRYLNDLLDIALVSFET